MKNNKRVLLGLSLASILAATSTAMAQTPWNPIPTNLFSFQNGVKMYAGGAIGYNKQDDLCNQTFFVGHCEDSSLSWRAYGGVRLNPMFGAELGYVSLGEANLKGTVNNEAATIKNSLSGYQLNAVAYMPVRFLKNTELVGKAGLMFWERDSRKTLGETSSYSEDKGVSPLFGVGAQYQLNRNLFVRGEWEHIFDAGAGSTHETDVNNYMLGLHYSTL